MIDGGCILILNAGSSSLKFALFQRGAEMRATTRGEIEKLETAPRFGARDAEGRAIAFEPWPGGAAMDFDAVLAGLLDFVEKRHGPGALVAAGHRVVHGGPTHIVPEAVTEASLITLEALTPLDPLHLPHNLRPIRSLMAARPDLPQVACFDTAFHHTMPPEATRMALPRDLTRAGLRRYGFHGLSYEYIVEKLRAEAPALARGKVIVAHLGAGASLCALRDGVSIETTMGFSVLDGLVMGTRCGSLDPGAIFYLARQGMNIADVETALYHRSGLLGVSGVSGDARDLIGNDDPNAREALDLFSYRAACEIGALTSALGGLDGLVFTAGIGENAPTIRAQICERLGWLGVRLDPTANAANASRISADESRVEVRVIATDEEAMIARHTLAVIDAAGAPARH